MTSYIKEVFYVVKADRPIVDVGPMNQLVTLLLTDI